MAYEEEEIDPGVDGGEGMVSPLQMLMMGYSTVTPEGKAKAAEVFEDLYGKRSEYDEAEQSAYDEYETQAKAARETLRRAREVLAAKRTPSTRWLEMAKGFGSATRAGSFGESVANYADARIPGRQREAEWEANRDSQLLQFDQGMSGIDQQLAMNKLKMKQLRRGADDKLMIESMKIMGKPIPNAGKKTPRQEVQGSLDKAYSKDYLAFIQGGAAEAAKHLKELKRAKEVLVGNPATGVKGTDMVSGPVIGIVPKVLRDIFLPKSSETQENIESTVQSSLKEILGSQFTEKEGERLLARTYNPRFEEPINARRAQNLIDRIERAYAEKVRAAQYFEQYGTLAGYKGKVAWSMDDFDVDMPQDDDPAAIADDMLDTVTHPNRRPAASTQQVAAPPQEFDPAEGMDEIDIEMLLPAKARGGRIQGYAEGGKVKQAKKVAEVVRDFYGNPLRGLRKKQAIAARQRRIEEQAEWEATKGPDRVGALVSDFEKKYGGFAQGGAVGGDFPGGRVQFAEGGKVQTIKNLITTLGADNNALLRSLKTWAKADGYPETPEALRAYSAKLMKMADVSGDTPDNILAEALQDNWPFYRFDEWRSGDKQFDLRYSRGKDADPEGFAEGGAVEGDFPDGRPRFRMPDGEIIKARPGDDYETVLQIYTTATGTAPTRPGLPPQQIPPREDVPPGPAAAPPLQPPAAMPPQQAAPPQQEQPPSFGEVALEELPSSLAYTAAGAAGAGLGDKVLTGAGDRLIPGRRESPAQRRVLDMMQERSRSPQAVAAGVRQTQKMGIPAMAMDDPSLRATADNVLPESGLQNATTILQRLKDRAGGLEERVTEQVNQNLKPDDFFDKEKHLLDDLYSNSDPLYKKAYAQFPTVKSKVLGALLNTPDGKKAVKSALREMRNSGKKIGKQDAMGMVTSPSLEFLDRVKRGLDDLITKEEGHGMNYKATSLGKSMRGLRDALRNEMDAATTIKGGNSLYQAARAQYAGDLEVLDALRAGRDDFSKLQPQQLDKLMAGVSFAEKDAFRSGVAQSLFENLQAPTTDVNSARRIIGSTAMQAKLRTMFDNDKQFELFKTALEKEAELHELDKKSIRRGEAGQELHAEPKDGMVKRGAKYVPRLGWKSPTMWALQFIRNNVQATEKKMDDVLKHLKASTPDELADLEKTLGPKYARRLSRKGRAAKTAVAGALAGAVYKVATGAEPDAEEEDYAEQE